ncbi:MAG: hypothetical protein HQK96_09175 [Nitrospirae bacterium]|nr:hypothetical protein [Nitrospirota bacterium]
MRRRPVIVALIIVFLLLSATLVLYSSITKPIILVIHSYDPDYAWCRDITVGAHRVLKKHPNYSVKWFYMDLKNHNDPAFRRKAGIQAREAVQRWQPNVLILIDDDASELVGRHYVNNPKINIVFAGLNGEYSPYGYDKAVNATGILEHKQFQAMKETIETIEKTSKGHESINKSYNNGVADRAGHVKIMYIADNSTSLAIDKIYIDQFDWRPFEYLGSYVARDFEEWKKFVIDGNNRADYILLANYRTLKRTNHAGYDELVHPNEVVQWTNTNSKVPVIGLNLFNVEDGCMLSIGVSPFEQGEVAAAMAVDIIDKHISPRDIPIRLNKQFVVAMRHSMLTAKGIALPEVYEVFARSTDNYKN